MAKKTRDPRAWLTQMVNGFLADSPTNTMANQAGDRAWDDALVGFAAGDDPLWQRYKEYVGPFHWTPWEVFNQHYPGDPVTAEELSVISWVLPQREMVRRAHRRAKKWPSEAWARTRIYGEECNMNLRQHVVDELNKAGHHAVSPMLAKNWTRVESQRFGFASTWSERHAAHAAGLGTFGLCDGLITARGKAMRLGSVVAKIKLEPTPRTYDNHRAYCPFFIDGSCGKCIDRCPVGALSPEGHDKLKCRQHLLATRVQVPKAFGFPGYGCGLCQVGVPCESGIPVKKAREALKKGEAAPLSYV